MDLNTALSEIRAGKIRDVDLRFTDLRGAWQHLSIPATLFDESTIEKGVGFDGSSIKGFQSIYESDMLLLPDSKTLFLDPFFEETLVCICDIYDPIKKEYFEKDPRYTAKKAVKYLTTKGIGDVSYWGPELEFFVFDKLDYELSPYHSFISIKSKEISLPEEDGRCFKIPNKGGYFPVPPYDKLQTFRSELVKILADLGIETEAHHHEVATAGQVEIDMKYDSLVEMADKVMIYKYVARNLANKYNMTVSFLPKPIFGDNGSGMHTHQSIFKAGKNIFFDPAGYAELSKTALSYTAGLLSNIIPLLAITNPTVNSYRRLVPHFEAPTAVAFSKRNRSAAVRIPMYFSGVEKAKRIEFRCPDPTTNPYLSFSAQLTFGLSGVEKELNPVDLGFGPFDENIWKKKKVAQTPDTIFETLAALSKDEILTSSGVFSKELLSSYLAVKQEETRTNLLYPTVADFAMYSDI
jgi:glutamine synthetase